jgi:hypothetical protein
MRTGIAGEAPGQLPYNVGLPIPGWTADIEVAIVRSARESLGEGRRRPSIPSTEDIESDTDQADMDAAILWNAIQKTGGPEDDQLGQIPATIQFGEVQGGLTAVVLSTTINLWEIPAEEE